MPNDALNREPQQPSSTDDAASPFAVPGLDRIPIGQHPPSYTPYQSPGLFQRLFGGFGGGSVPQQQQAQFIPGPSSAPMQNAMMNMVPLNMGLTPPAMGTGGVVMSSDVAGATLEGVRGAKKKKTDPFHFRRYREE